MEEATERIAAAGGEARWRDAVRRWREGAPPPFSRQWEVYRECFGEPGDREAPPLAWRPGEEQTRRSNLAWLLGESGAGDYAALHAWTVADKERFWRLTLERLGVVFRRPPDRILDLGGEVEDPVWLPGAEMNVAESCLRAAPGAPAVVAGREGDEGLRTVSYGELEKLADRVAHGLRGAGLAAGEAVALYMPMTVECVAAYLGAVKAGCPVVSIADSFSAEELARRLEIGEARAVVTVASYHWAGRSIDLYEKVRAAGAPAAVVLPPAAGEPPELRAGDLAWADFLGPPQPFAAVAGDPYRVTNVLFSSGTTGTPKAIPWTHLTPLKCAMDGHFHQDVRPGDVVAWPTNIGWMMGPWLIYAALVNRATIALYEGAPTGPGFARFVRDAGVTMLGVVPSLVRAWRTAGSSPDATEDGALSGIDWSGVRLFSSTGEPSNRRDYLWLMSRTGYRAPVIEYLGGTEIGGGHITGSVLQPASPSTFTTPALGCGFVVLGEDARPVAEGEMGELYLVPPALGLSQTLLNRDHHEVYYAGCPRGPAGQTLRRHGDEFVRLPGGFWRAQGRADDTMNLGGIKVGSVELERVMDAHPAVYESAAVAVQPAGGGADRLVAYVVPAGETDPATLRRELQRQIASRLNPLFKIHDLVLVDRLPRTASNKLMRRKLRAAYGAPAE